MERINYNSLRLEEFLDKLNPQNSGIILSLLIHLMLLLFAVGIPNFFGPKEIYIPKIIPIEIMNIAKETNIEKTNDTDQTNKNTQAKQKKFNSSEITEVQKKVNLSQNSKNIIIDEQPQIELKQKKDLNIQEKKNIETKEKKILQPKTKIETIKTDQIKPKLKPKLTESSPVIDSDVQIEPKSKEKTKSQKKVAVEPIKKPEQDFNQMLASSLKDLRNKNSNNILDDETEKKENKSQTNNDLENKNNILSISEIDLLIQQLSSCWIAPAGAVIPDSTIIKISASVARNMEVLSSSIRIVDTNLSISNPFYGPITDSAKRTLLNPECTPLKLPQEKYDVWKNLTIRFDHDIMKGN